MQQAEQPVQLQFDDNTLLPLLYGEHDQNLARIEQQLGVSLISRGNRLVIDGPADSADAARRALADLYGQLERGLALGPGEIDAAVRMAAHLPPAAPPSAAEQDALTLRTRKRYVGPRSPGQQNYVTALKHNDMVFGVGPAGTGKTYLAVAAAVAQLLEGRVDRIILSRPAVEAGERLGFLPGDLKEKVDPYLRPLYDALHDMLPGDHVRRRMEAGDIEIAPLAFMRGRTLSNSYVILDEAQNTTPMQMKMFLTRLGENSRMVITGDMSQIDLPAGTESGLLDATTRLENIDGIAIVRFTAADIVRHGLVTRIVQAYDTATEKRTDKRAAKRTGKRDD